MTYVRECFAYVSSRSFMLLCLIFRCLNHIEFIFCVRFGSALISSIYMRLSSFTNTTCLRDCLFTVVYSCLLCCRLINCSHVGLFLGTVFCSIDLYVFVPIQCCFDYCSFVVLSEVWEGYASSFVLFPQDCFGNSGSFVVPDKF